MKKHIISPVLVFAVLAMASCSDYDETENFNTVAPGSNEVEIVFEASMQAGNLQKTAVATDGFTLYLLGEENMTVVANDDGHSSFVARNSKTATATFSCRVGLSVLDASSNFVAMYPIGEYYSDGKYKMSVPAIQTATADSFDPEANLLIASTTKDAMKFSLKNVCSYAKVAVSAPVEWIKLSANENIAGEVIVNTDGTCDGGSANAITLLPANGETTIAPGTYYIAVKPGKVSGLKIDSDVFGAVSSSDGDFSFLRSQTHNAIFKTFDVIKSVTLDAYLKSITPADGEVTVVDLFNFDSDVVKTALLNNLDKKVHLVLPENRVVEIPNEAFSGCTGLKELTIKGSPTLGTGVFDNCSPDLTVKVNLETYLKYHNDYPMMVCPNYAANLDDLSKCEGDEIYFDLTTYDDPDAVKTALQNTDKKVTLKLPSDVTAIDAYAFQNCASLKEIILPEGLTTIGAGAFKGSGLSEIPVPASVTSLGPGAFESCKNLTSINLPSGLKTIDGQTFAGCTKLSQVTLPESLEILVTGAFQGCSELQSITIPAGVKLIPSYVFYNCTKLKEITILGTIYDFGNSVFSNCSPDLVIYVTPQTYYKYRSTYKQMTIMM